MPRPRKNPEYDPQQLMKELMEEIVFAYRNPEIGRSDIDGNASLNSLAEEFMMTPLKIRKLLITAGAYRCEQSKIVNDLKSQGKTIEEIQKITGLSRASVHSYLPYTKVIYNMKELSAQAERLRRYRERKNMCEKLSSAMGKMPPIPYDLVWRALEVFVGYPFKTEKGHKFTYQIHGDEIFFSISKQSVTSKSVNESLEAVLELGHDGVEITGPKQLGTCGASYLFPVFQRIGIIAATI